MVSATVLNAAPPRQLVLLDHDGGFPDDYLATALLLTMDSVKTLGVVVTPADSYLEPAVSATRNSFAPARLKTETPAEKPLSRR